MTRFSILYWKLHSKHDLELIPYNVKKRFRKNDTRKLGNVILF